jgi:hypothetical protein
MNWEGCETDRNFQTHYRRVAAATEIQMQDLNNVCSVHTVSTAEFEMRTFQKGLEAIVCLSSEFLALHPKSLRKDAKSESGTEQFLGGAV